MNPYPGLTLESPEGDLVNVHVVKKDEVFWGAYENETDPYPCALVCSDQDEWEELFVEAIDMGSACYSLLHGDPPLFGMVGVFDAPELKVGPISKRQ